MERMPSTTQDTSPHREPEAPIEVPNIEDYLIPGPTVEEGVETRTAEPEPFAVPERPEAPLERESVAIPEEARDDPYGYNPVKEAVLDAGGVTSEPLEGNPFVLSEGHEAVPGMVTVYSPDGTKKQMTSAEYDARLAEQKAAAAYFSERRPGGNATADAPKMSSFGERYKASKKALKGFFSWLFKK